MSKGPHPPPNHPAAARRLSRPRKHTRRLRDGLAGRIWRDDGLPCGCRLKPRLSGPDMQHCPGGAPSYPAERFEEAFQSALSNDFGRTRGEINRPEGVVAAVQDPVMESLVGFVVASKRVVDLDEVELGSLVVRRCNVRRLSGELRKLEIVGGERVNRD